MHTNSTPNLELSQFVNTDKPTWLGDVNGDMLKIDTAYAAVGAVASGADSKADTAISTANTASTTATDAATLANTANTNAQSALTTAGNAATAASAAQSAASAVDTKVGDLTDLTTTDKTSVVAAINEVESDAGAIDTKVGALTDLTTTDKSSIVAAINEVNAGGGSGGDAEDITYDNTTSGLLATNVQAAIDELKALITPNEVTGAFDGTGASISPATTYLVYNGTTYPYDGTTAAATVPNVAELKYVGSQQFRLTVNRTGAYSLDGGVTYTNILAGVATTLSASVGTIAIRFN